MLKLLLMLAVTQSPVTECHIAKSGQTVFAAPPAGQPTAPVVIPPVLARGNWQLPLAPGPVSANGWWSWSLAEPVQATDTLRLKAPAGWIAGAPALDVEVRNSTGKLEWDLPAPVMSLGVNLAQTPMSRTSLWCPVRNWATRLDAFDANCLATDAMGLPTKTKGATAASFVTASSFGLPTPSGLWTVVYDSPNGTECSIVASGAAQWICAARADLFKPGTGGAGITRVYQVTPSIGGTSPSPQLSISVNHTGWTPSLANLQILPPGNAPTSDRFAVEQSVADQLTVNGRGPATIRWVDACTLGGGQSNIVDPADLVSCDRASWTTRSRVQVASVASIRPLDLAVSPAVLGTPWGDLPIPAISAFDYGKRVIVECTSVVPHNFRSGQGATVKFGPGLAAVSQGKPITIPPALGYVPVWVTSPTTFVTSWYDSTLATNGAQTLDAPLDTPGATVTVSVPGGSVVPIEFAVAASSRLGSTCWLTVPAAATDACIDEFLRRVLAFSKAGDKVILEVSNEVFNSSNAHTTYYVSLNALTGVNAYIKRSADLQARARAAFILAGRPDDVLVAICWQWGFLDGLLGKAAAQGFAADVVGYAPYYTLGVDGTGREAKWAALVSGWTPAQIHDLMRHYIMADPWCVQHRRQNAAAIVSYETAIGRKVLRYTYEGADEEYLGRSWEVLWHSDMVDTSRVMYAVEQAAGADVFTYYSLCMRVEPRPPAMYLWGLIGWQQQQPGDGRSNVAFGAPGWTSNVSPRSFAWRAWQGARAQ